MSANADTITLTATSGHPKGLYVLFATEMWERFSFYSMLSLFTLYLRTDFGFTGSEATTLNANYLMFVYASPLIGGLVADRITGYRKAVMIGGVFFMLGHGLLSIPAMWAVYVALVCLVIGNGFFKPNVSTMVGNLYPEGSHLKDRAYNIFYFGINVGAFIAPIVMQVVKDNVSVHAAFAVAAFGMLISIGTLWYFKEHVIHADKKFAKGVIVVGDNVIENSAVYDSDQAADTAATAVDAPPHGVSSQDETHDKGSGGDAGRSAEMGAVANWKRVAALLVIFAIVIVFWMVFHQNSSTLTYFAEDNTSIPGTISQSINAFWVLTLTFPLVWFWGWLDRRGKEPSTPTKMAFGMTLTGLSFLVLWVGAGIGERAVKTPDQLSSGEFRINERVATNLAAQGMPKDVIDKIMSAKDPDPPSVPVEPGLWNSVMGIFASKPEGKKIVNGVKFSALSDKALEERDKENVEKGKPVLTAEERTRLKSGELQLIHAVNSVAPGAGDTHRAAIMQNAYLFHVPAIWLILGYMIVTLGELMLSPMGLSLVSKVAPIGIRGLMMGGWFVATAIGNKLTQIGIFWDIWLQSTFFLVLACMALFMAVVLAVLLKPLKKAMPGV
ncbi:MAG: peptide MFS transporter [Pyrinomonadaceae bacterium]|nr:peptide MFS transporter [Pyrinomonadaceae bacterium]